MNGGGTERVVLKLLERLPDYGFRTQLLVDRLQSPLVDQVPDQTEVYDLGASTGRITPAAVRRVAAALTRLHPNVVYAQGTRLIPAALARLSQRLDYKLVGCEHEIA